MKLLFVLSAVLLGTAVAESPVVKVITLIKGIQKTVKEEGATEQKEYDRYACWVEETLAAKGADIKTAEDLIVSLQKKIEKASGSIGSLSATVKSTEKMIADNKEETGDTDSNCKKATAEWVKKNTETETAMGALEQAINAIEGAGTGKKKAFLGTLQEASILSTAAGVRRILSWPVVQATASEDDLQLIQDFVSNPVSVLKSQMSAAQVSQNPFGDYAPKSSQISGLFKGLYDGMAQAIETANGEESKTQKSCREILATKAKELAALEESLSKAKEQKGDAESVMAESDSLQKKTQKQLGADEKFFEETKKSAESKAGAYNERVMERTKELADMQKARDILEAKSGLFKKVDSHLQMKQVSFLQTSRGSKGNFIQTMTKAIDSMIRTLEQETREDVENRDICQQQETANQERLGDAQHSIDTTAATIEKLTTELQDLQASKDKKQNEIKEIKAEMKEMLDQRNEEVATFRQEDKDNHEALATLNSARAVLDSASKTGLLQLGQEPPETSFDDKESYSTNEGHGGVLGFMDMIILDMEKQIKTSHAQNKKDEADYDKLTAAAQATLEEAQTVSARLSRQMQTRQEEKDETEKANTSAHAEHDAGKKEETALAENCKWTHDGTFESRKEERDTEMSGLLDAKSNLAGAV